MKRESPPTVSTMESVIVAMVVTNGRKSGYFLSCPTNSSESLEDFNLRVLTSANEKDLKS